MPTGKPSGHTPRTTKSSGDLDLRERCAKLSQQLQRDALLRQNDPVQTIMDFVLAEQGRVVELKGSMAVVLYFTTDKDREDFVQACLMEKRWRSRKVL